MLINFFPTACTTNIQENTVTQTTHNPKVLTPSSNLKTPTSTTGRHGKVDSEGFCSHGNAQQQQRTQHSCSTNLTSRTKRNTPNTRVEKEKKPIGHTHTHTDEERNGEREGDDALTGLGAGRVVPHRGQFGGHRDGQDEELSLLLRPCSDSTLA